MITMIKRTEEQKFIVLAGIACADFRDDENVNEIVDVSDLPKKNKLYQESEPIDYIRFSTDVKFWAEVAGLEESTHVSISKNIENNKVALNIIIKKNDLFLCTEDHIVFKEKNLEIRVFHSIEERKLEKRIENFISKLEKNNVKKIDIFSAVAEKLKNKMN